jgi:hypothetical protein
MGGYVWVEYCVGLRWRDGGEWRELRSVYAILPSAMLFWNMTIAYIEEYLHKPKERQYQGRNWIRWNLRKVRTDMNAYNIKWRRRKIILFLLTGGLRVRSWHSKQKISDSKSARAGVDYHRSLLLISTLTTFVIVTCTRTQGALNSTLSSIYCHPTTKDKMETLALCSDQLKWNAFNHVSWAEIRMNTDCTWIYSTSQNHSDLCCYNSYNIFEICMHQFSAFR